MLAHLICTDIIEGVNSQTNNLNSLHTSDQCSISGQGQIGSVVTGNCYQYDPNQSNSGCGVTDTRANVYGGGFNSIGGGVYAMEWTHDAIKIWFFPRQSIPGDIQAGTPNPGSWGTPTSNFGGNCNIPSHFAQHNVVFDTTFCGDWAGSVFGSDPVCGSKGSCQAYVAQNPGDFSQAFWSINYMSVYQLPGAGSGGLGSYMTEEEEADFAGAPAPGDPVAASRVVNPAMGGAPAPAPGITPPAQVPAAHLDQVPATANTTLSMSTMLA